MNGGLTVVVVVVDGRHVGTGLIVVGFDVATGISVVVVSENSALTANKFNDHTRFEF